jgi:tetratricopeptide (TPR) repeat protein
VPSKLTAARYALAIPALPVLGYAIVLAARLAYADALARQDTIPALNEAIRAFPGNADYHARMSDLDPARAAGEIRLALNLNPWRTEFWIAQSTIQELNLDSSASEKSLLEAARISRYYVPRWALANFYYRRRDPAQFRTWARQALTQARTAADVPSIIQMSRKLGLSSDDIRRNLLPDRPDVLQVYLQEVLRDKNWDQLYLVAGKLAAVGSSDHRDSILSSAEALFDAGRTGAAVNLWNTAAQQHWIPYAPLNPATGLSVTNGNFTRYSNSDALPSAFNWKIRNNDGISVPRPPVVGLRFEFSGKQSEACELLSQNIPLLPARKYELRVKYRTTGILPGTGIHWRILVPTGPAIAEGSSLSSEDLAEDAFAFQSPPQPMPLRLSLFYARAPGTVRVEGQLYLHSLQLSLAP